MNRIVRFSVILLLIAATGCTHLPPLAQTPKYPPPAPPIKNVNVALVLGGGGSKGMAHVGVLKVLEENKIPIDLIVGTSVGSAIGALYADGSSPAQIKQMLMPINKWDILDLSFYDSLLMFTNPTGPIRGYYYEKFFIDNLKSKNIEELKIPFIAVTTDITTSKLYIIRSGPIAPAIHASSAIPPFFAPVNMYGKTLVDGGVRAPVPVEIAKQFHPKIIIAVDIGAPPPSDPLGNVLDLTYKAVWIFYYELSRIQAKTADIEIRPSLDGYGMFDDDKKEEVYQAGENATQMQMKQIIRRLAELNIPLKK